MLGKVSVCWLSGLNMQEFSGVVVVKIYSEWMEGFYERAYRWTYAAMMANIVCVVLHLG